jgi:uncharacterized protein (TIGR03084 family)
MLASVHMGDRPSLPDVVADLRAEHADLMGLVAGTDLDLPTPAEPWDVRDTVAHLAGFDLEAATAASRPEEFLAGLPEVAKDIDGFMRRQLEERRALSRDELLDDWRRCADSCLDAVARLEAGVEVPWYGPPMSPVSFATARLMEYWAHGQDVADAAGVERTPTARLRHVCHLGVRTRGFSYAVRGLAPPPADVRVELSAPGGGTWAYGPEDATDRVSGPAVDFCLLVTQRRHRDDTALLAEGPAADEWLGIAQCFAGPPGPGRPPRGAA